MDSPKLHDMPQDELPREKLAAHGRASLSDEELIAIFLRTGLPGCNVLELAAQLKRKAGSLAALGTMEAGDIANVLDKGIGPAKAATLAAVFELGQRAAKETLSNCEMSDPAHVYDYLAGELRFELQEHLIALLLDARHRLLRRVDLAKGTLTRVITHPRDVFRDAIRYNAASLLLVHNHPSGDPTPSKPDNELTDRLAKVGELIGIRLLDHVIIGAPSPARTVPYYSFRNNGKL